MSSSNERSRISEFCGFITGLTLRNPSGGVQGPALGEGVWGSDNACRLAVGMGIFLVRYVPELIIRYHLQLIGEVYGNSQV